MIMVSSIVSSRFGEGFRRPSDREDIVYLDRGQLGLDNDSGASVASVVYTSCRLILRSRTPGASRLEVAGVPSSWRQGLDVAV